MMNHDRYRLAHPNALKVLLVTTLLIWAGASQAADIVVNTHRDDLPPLADGLCSLSEALENARLGGNPFPDCASGTTGTDQILIQPGLPPIEVVSPLQLTTAVQIVGPPNRQMIRPAAGFSRNLFRLDADSTTSGTFVLENLLLADGLATFTGPVSECSHSGSAICITQNIFNPQPFTVIIRNTIFDDNVNPVHCVGPQVSLRVEQSLFTDSISSISTKNDCSATIRETSLEFSSAGSGTTAAVGALNANLFIFDSSIDPSGGSRAVFVSSSSPRLFVMDNSMVLDTVGDGITLQGAVLASISNSTIARNSGTGVVFDSNGGNLQIFSSTIANNTPTSAFPGGLRLINGQTSIENSSLIENGTGGSAGQSASGIQVDGGSVSIKNTVLSNLAQGEGNLWRINGGIINLRYSLLTAPDTASEINGANQNNVFIPGIAFGLLTDEGCRKPVGFPGNPTHTCVLVRPHGPFQTSIIDAAQPNGTWDQRGEGFARSFGGGQDIGAYELQDPLVEFEPVQVVQNEGTAAGFFTDFFFTVRRLGPDDGQTTAGWEVFGHGSNPVDAADFDDSILPSGSVFFDIGEREKTIVIPVHQDNLAEADEGFRVVLQNITDGQPGIVTEAFATVLNDDALFLVPTLSIEAIDTNKAEGDVFYTPHRFRVTRSQDTSGFCSFRLNISGAGFTPIQADDLAGGWTLGPSANSYQMAPGVVFNDIDILIAGDSNFEADELFNVELTDVSGCFVNSNRGNAIGTVLNDDSLFAAQSIDMVNPEGDGGVTEFSLRINRSGFVDKSASVSWSVSGTGTHPADANDFEGGVLPAGSITMPPGVTSVPITIRVQGDGMPEEDEDFRVQLGNPRSGGSIDPLADFVIGTIINDDNPDTLFKDSFE
ncbi:MAG: hypothetical protein Kow0020_14290 [Wenzhouxiangellaceae bacterium]